MDSGNKITSRAITFWILQTLKSNSEDKHTTNAGSIVMLILSPKDPQTQLLNVEQLHLASLELIQRLLNTSYVSAGLHSQEELLLTHSSESRCFLHEGWESHPCRHSQSGQADPSHTFSFLQDSLKGRLSRAGN